MRTWPSRSLIRLIRSMPSPFLRVISTTATSGWASAVSRRASLMSAASPQTSRSGCRPIRKESASRTAGWSSTIKTRFRFFVFFRLIVLPRQRTGDYGTIRLGRIDGQGGSDNHGAAAHDAQPQAPVRLWPCRHADAVVLDAEHQAHISSEADADLPGLRVFDGIVDGFLDDEIKLGGGHVVGDRNRCGAVER